jgi:uncharacterized protein YdhG (YjbR/CyaY superfamily)
MQAAPTTPATIDEYIQRFPGQIQALLEELRSTIRQVAPQAVEKISYQMPCFYFNGNLVYFAAFKQHIGFYPTSGGIIPFMEELKSFKSSKGAIQFPLDKPLPLMLVKRIVEYRVAENSVKISKTTSKKSA